MNPSSSRKVKNKSTPVLKHFSKRFKVAKRKTVLTEGGLGVIPALVKSLQLDKTISDNLNVLQRHRPYTESDHILSLAYNLLAGGECIEDLHRRKHQPAYLKALGTSAIPAPTTAGDFLRRFTTKSIYQLQEAINSVRPALWKLQSKAFRQLATVDIDGTYIETTGECKQGMGLSYKGKWGYMAQVLSLNNSREVLYTTLRSGSRTSNHRVTPLIQRAINLLKPHFCDICLRGDSDFALTDNFDTWDDQCMFLFGYDAKQNLINLADAIAQSDWEELRRFPAYEIKTTPRGKQARYKERVVRKKGYKNIRLEGEQVTELEYRPGKCKRNYRLIIVRKNLLESKGQADLFNFDRYFFYITNISNLDPHELVAYINGRCDHENDIEQLKNHVGAMRAPSQRLMANWAYMVIGALAWNLKCFYGLCAASYDKRKLLRMEWKRFLNTVIRLPCEVIYQGRRTLFSIVGGVQKDITLFLRSFERIRCLRI